MVMHQAHIRGRLLLIAFVLLLVVFAVPVRSEANSCVIQFSTASAQVKRGELFTIVCQVTSGDPFLDVSFIIDYDDNVMHFVKGGKKVSGGYGELTVDSSGNLEETYKKTFSLQFMGKRNGSGLISVKDSAEITDAAGNAFSVSSNRLSIQVSKKGSEDAGEKDSPAPAAVTPSPVLSKNNRLKSLKTTAYTMTPVFSGNVTEYSASVDSSAETLYVSFVPEDERARVRVYGNESLKPGNNQVTVQVTSESGKTRKYRINVYRETKEETEERTETKEEKKKDMSFSVLQRADTVFIQNAYEFEVLDADELKEVPEGYIQSKIVLDGVSVTAFTMEEELDSNYLLLYLKGPSGERGLYQYDREEKTLQRYTGNMVERINHGSTSSDGGSLISGSTSGYVMLTIIVVLVILVLCLLIAMLKMAIRRKEEMERW